MICVLVGTSGLALVAAACTAGSGPGSDVWLIPPRQPQIRVLVAQGCPASIGGNADVSNDQSGLDDHLLPAQRPIAGLICRYSPTTGAPSLDRQTRLGPAAAARLANAIAAISTAAPHGATSCPADFDSASVIAMSYRDRPDVDLWYHDSGCQTLDNGRVGAFQGGNPAFYGPFETLIGPSGARPGGSPAEQSTSPDGPLR